MKPHVFVGSSTDGLDVAIAVQSNLESTAEVTIWSQDVFLPGENVLEALLCQAERSDFAVFVFSTDVIVSIRGSEQLVK
ncbi:MAG: TIR domain-containing protein [Nitrospirota bacterium]